MEINGLVEMSVLNVCLFVQLFYHIDSNNRLFLCPPDVLNVLYYHQPVSCALVTHIARLRVKG